MVTALASPARRTSPARALAVELLADRGEAPDGAADEARVEGHGLMQAIARVNRVSDPARHAMSKTVARPRAWSFPVIVRGMRDQVRDPNGIIVHEIDTLVWCGGPT